MSRNYLRSINVQVGSSSQSIDLSAMRVKFHVLASTSQTPNSAEVRVYNLSKETAKKLAGRDTEFKKITLSAGYPDNMGVIYQGTIIHSQTGRETPTETFADFFCRTGDKPYNFATVNKTFAAGSKQRDHIDEVLRVIKPMGFEEGIIKGLREAPFPRAVSLFGMARDVLRNIAHTNDAAWYFLGDKLHHVPNKDPGRSGGFVLNENTGLIGMPVETQSGIVVTALINPQFEVGKQLVINQASIQRAPWTVNQDAELLAGQRTTGVDDGTYKIQSIEWRGDTHGQEWYATMLCYGSVTGAPGIGTENILPGYSGAQ